MAMEKKSREKKFFNLPENERHFHDVEEAEKKDQKKAADKVFDCFNKKNTGTKPEKK